MIELQGVRKDFGRSHAVEGISLVAEGGGIFGMLGPNGAGKSTTIKMIVDILKPDSGTILFDGRLIRGSDKDRIGYLPEERGLYRRVRIDEMLLYLASLKNVDRATAAKRLDGWLDRFGLEKSRSSFPETLSKGMAQKVQFIAAVLHEPEFIFLDEPFSGLDPVSADSLREAVLELGDAGRTIVLSTHDMEAAERLCSRILIIDHGREVASGSLAEIKSRFGRDSVIVEFDGTIDFGSLAGIVGQIRRFPRWIEIELAKGADAQRLLRLLVDQVTVRKFELVAPSLHDIFVELVGGKHE